MKGDFTRSTFRREKHYSGVRMQQGRVQLDADWNEQVDVQAYLDRTTRYDVIGPCGAPRGDAGFALQMQDGNPWISAGRYYVDGILCENEQDVPLANQPDLPGFALPEDPGLYLAYLDVCQRHMTALEDPAMREVALGGPDTATRTKTVWQVNFLRVGDVDDAVDCSQFGPGWLPEETPSTGMLRARVQRGATSDDPCILPPQAGYRRLENQLYRVEIHDGGSVTTGATFKWSRDNGSLATLLEKIDGDILTVSDPGRSGQLRFASGQWVELTDEGGVLRGEPGALVQLAAVQGSQLTVVAWPDGGPPVLGEKKWTVRRWDSPGAIPLTSGGYLDLEDGVQVEFGDGEYRSGDYWMIPARTALGDVLWPLDEVTSEPLFEARHGTDHHYCALALLQFGENNWMSLGDCRRLFPPLTELKDEEPGIHITGVLTTDANEQDVPVRNDTEVPADFLVQGLRVICDADIDQGAVHLKPTCFVTLEMPFPFNAADRELWGSQIIGNQPLILAAEVNVENQVIFWKPEQAVIPFLQETLFMRMTELRRGHRVLARLTLQGNFIWASDKPELYLDGDVLGYRQPGGTNIDLRLPSGDRVRGGHFDMWFWLVPSRRAAPNIRVEPTKVDFGKVRIGSSVSAKIKVANAGTAELRGTTVPINNARFSVEPEGDFTLDPGPGTKELTVKFSPSRPGDQTGVLPIASNDPSNPTVIVHLRGSGVGFPRIVVEPTKLDFGKVTVGSPSDLPLTVRNTGSVPLDVTNLLIDNAESFRVLEHRGPLGLGPARGDRLNPNAQLKLVVRFTPMATGVQAGVLTITSNDPDNPTASVQLIGRGIIGGRIP